MQLSITIPPLPRQLTYADEILLIGSCFTEHISSRLAQHKFRMLANPHGILFNPLSVANSLSGYIDGHLYTPADLFYLNELWNSWAHHTRFSHIDVAAALAGINESQAAATACIHKAGCIIITLGSAFQYYLRDSGLPVANNHRAPAQWFDKKLLAIDDIVLALTNMLHKLAIVNPSATVIFTISPVRHIRDGVAENNRSKARLIEAVHTLCASFCNSYYFPAYELIIDVLRDYRYYDTDLVHPNYAATSYVWDHFVKSCIAPQAHPLMQQLHDIAIARGHRPRFPQTQAHQQFMRTYATKAAALAEKHPYIDLADEMAYFNS